MNKKSHSQTPAAHLQTEIELKLCGDPDDLETVFSSPAISGKATRRGAIQRLENTYYDTPDHRLRARGLALRVRRRGRSYVQTLKSNDAGGLAAYRGEWETPLASAEPDLELLPAGALEALDGVATRDDLRSLFTTRVRRRVRRLEAPGRDGRASAVEVAFDIGTIEADGGSIPIAEVELELLGGSRAVLYDLALELDALAPLHVETRSKSARGYALATGEPPAWHKSEPSALRPETTVDEALGAILRNCVEHWCANEAAAHDGRDPEGVHQMRVGIRRLRSAFSVFRRILAPDRRAKLSGDAKRTINGLGPARDLDVFITELLGPVLQARPGDEALVRLATAAERARQHGYEAARKVIASPEYTRFMLELRRWIEARGWRDEAPAKGAAWLDRPIVAFADHLLAKRHRQALKLGHGFAELGPEERHQVRIALKKLRYASEFFGGLYPKRDTKPYLAALKHLQDALGHLNDVAVAERLVGGLIDEAGAGPERELLNRAGGLVLGWHARGVADLEPAAVDAWRKFTDRKSFWH